MSSTVARRNAFRALASAIQNQTETGAVRGVATQSVAESFNTKVAESKKQLNKYREAAAAMGFAAIPLMAGPAALAEEAAPLNLKVVGAGLATIALAGVGVGIGSVYAALIQGCAIQPSASKDLFGHAILGFAMVEAVGLFAMMLAFLILFGN